VIAAQALVAIVLIAVGAGGALLLSGDDASEERAVDAERTAELRRRKLRAREDAVALAEGEARRAERRARALERRNRRLRRSLSRTRRALRRVSE
jgi:hypothetical protein